MPPQVFIDPTQLDFDHPIAGREQVQQLNRQRYEFQLLDAVVLCDRERVLMAGYHDVRPDAWWVRGHIPGRPLFPGVLMIECAAQLSSFLYHQFYGSEHFLGFVGVDDVKFRGTVEPPARFVVVARGREIKRKRLICETQGFVDGRFVYEGVITGMMV